MLFYVCLYGNINRAHTNTYTYTRLHRYQRNTYAHTYTYLKYTSKNLMALIKVFNKCGKYELHSKCRIVLHIIR